MSIRISVVNQDQRLTIRVEGRLLAADAAALSEDYGRSARLATLDLSGLLGADEAALRVLLAFEAAGAALSGASTYVAYLLESSRGGDASTKQVDSPSS